MTVHIDCEMCDGTGVLFDDVCRFCRPHGTFHALVERFTRAKERLGHPPPHVYSTQPISKESGR
jgi:hypothetical protein